MLERRLVVPGRYDQVRVVCDFVTQAAEEACLNEAEMFHCQLAVDEACTNIIEHAYRGENRGEIEVVCECDDGELTIVLHDQGASFDPTTIPEPGPIRSLEDVGVGGHGLYFIRRLMTSVDYSTDENGNTWVMVKRSDGQGIRRSGQMTT